MELFQPVRLRTLPVAKTNTFRVVMPVFFIFLSVSWNGIIFALKTNEKIFHGKERLYGNRKKVLRRGEMIVDRMIWIWAVIILLVIFFLS